jgi:cobalt-zinc-cadmium efflux system outer membrane protein
MKFFYVLFFLVNLIIIPKDIQILSLKQALSIAKLNNPIYLAEKNTIGIAKGDLISSKLLPNPVLNNEMLVLQKPSTGNLLTPGTGGTGGAINSANRQDWIQVTQKIPVAGQREYGIQLAKKNLELAGNNLTEFERNILLQVSLKWLDVWFALEKLNIIQRTKNFTEELLNINKIRLKNQVITQAEFLRTKNIVEQYDATYSLATQNYINELRILKFLLGTEEHIETLREDPIFSKEVEPLETLLSESIKNRPDLLTTKTSVEAARVNVKLQEAFAYPSPDIGLVYNPQNNTPYFGTVIFVQIPINNRNQGEIYKSNSQLKQAIGVNTTLELRIKTELDNSYGEYRTTKTNLEKFKSISENAEKVVETVKYSYLKGGTNIIDYLDAQRSWFDSQILFYESIYSYRKSFIQLLYVTARIQKLE